MSISAPIVSTSAPIVIAEGAEDAPEQLLKQFSDPLDCLRELIQNSVDSGSAEVHVSCTFEDDLVGAPPGIGAAVLRVKDYGEGMDRHAIDTRLTRLCSSDKLHDRTKIGRFGIGFISVFVLSPDVVCVDTGKNGESWRVLFRPNRSFVRVYLPEPIEGTCVRLWKAMSRAEFELFEPKVRHALHHHARFLSVTLTYQGVVWNTSAHQGALVSVESTVNGETIVASYPLPGEPNVATFANRGLTLMERASEIAGVSYVVNSSRLEHTLGRDSIVQDEHYAELKSSVRALSNNALPDALSQKLDEGLRKERPDGELMLLQARLAELITSEEILPATCAQRAVARSPHGELYTLEACLLAGSSHRLFTAALPSPLSASVCATGKLVLEDWQSALATALCHGEAPRLERHFYLPLQPPANAATRDKLGARAEALCACTLSFLRAVSPHVSAVILGYLDYPGSGVGDLPAVVQDQPFTLGAVPEALPERRFWDGNAQPHCWVLNVDHPGVRALLPLAGPEPELAAYNLIKLCLHGGALSPELDSRLLTLAMEERCLRQETDR